MKCSAHKTDGTDCKAQAIKGGSVCRVHGGSAPQVRAAATRRLLEAIDPAAAELVRLAMHGESESVRLNAIKEIFERAGFGDPKRIEISQVPDAETVRGWIEALEADIAADTG